MKKTPRKLQLDTHTVRPLVRELDNESLAAANGGSMRLPAVQQCREAAR